MSYSYTAAPGIYNGALMESNFLIIQCSVKADLPHWHMLADVKGITEE